MKIIVRPLGGIGNQLFGYAAARALAIRNDCELVIDDLSGFSYDHRYRRKCQLHHFSIPCRIAKPAERLEPLSRLRRFIRKRVNKRKDFFDRDYIAQEVFDFDERLLHFRPHRDTIVEGYWQSEKYFEEKARVIRSDLEIRSPTDADNLAMAGRIAATNAVAVHFRYFNPEIKNPDNLPLDYYIRALARMSELVPGAHYFVFSDHPEMAMSSLPLPAQKFTLVSHNKSDAMAFADLWLMRQCRHFVIANSTFSWWGAWLSDSGNKRVIAPSLVKRSGDSWWGFDGLLPDDWLKL
jgi:hypothetical protein